MARFVSQPLLDRGVDGGRGMASGGSTFPAAWQIPVDFTVRKGYPGLTKGDLSVYDADGNLRFRVRTRCFGSSPGRAKTLHDALGNPLITCVHHQGRWQGFRGNSWEGEDMIFTAHKTADSPFDTELDVFLMTGNWGQPSLAFRLKGSPFQRSCTIYKGNSIVAQTNPNYKLRKVVYSRHKFRLTVYPGIDHALVVSLLVIFFGGH
uniref:Protein LURP-one-related 7 n=1 Tax=Anthurium amnicola TaxID=1678845 RepID=A0A1D1YQ88_9ARAE